MRLVVEVAVDRVEHALNGSNAGEAGDCPVKLMYPLAFVCEVFNDISLGRADFVEDFLRHILVWTRMMSKIY